ncbi:MAG: hypothetical protein BWY09_01579 [Candidatus Hydrogenedentes bacterium ADurb.Bin179]|nr:MAG: hypothetical protein BWY09_01579 [Candidatus Hydrogenedentes bacterium ADurb.Bin179]
MVLNPSRLKCRVLAAVRKNNHLLVPLGRRVQHSLSQNVNIGHLYGADRTYGFQGTAADLHGPGAAGWTGFHDFREYPHRQQSLFVTAPVRQAMVACLTMKRTAMTTKKSGFW